MQGPCFCRPGLLSQCVASNYEEQKSCRFFVKSDCTDRCMNRNELMNNHCWHPEAQSLGLQSSEVERDFVDDEEGWALKDKKVICLDCLHYTCPKLMKLSVDARDSGGLTYEDLETIARSCKQYTNPRKELETTP